MKTLLLLGAAALSLTGCDGTKCDTGDSACAEAVQITYVNGDCVDNVCTWTMETDGQTGLVELDLAETGDTSGFCDENPVCGGEAFWTEFHDDFQLVEFDEGTETKEINLGLVTSFESQVQNDTTIMNLNNAELVDQLTVLYTAYDKDGNYADCAVFGHDVSYFDCDNNADNW